jgi:hypothetical protein
MRNAVRQGATRRTAAHGGDVRSHENPAIFTGGCGQAAQPATCTSGWLNVWRDIHASGGCGSVPWWVGSEQVRSGDSGTQQWDTVGCTRGTTPGGHTLTTVGLSSLNRRWGATMSTPGFGLDALQI